MVQAPDSGVMFQEELASEPFWMLVACILVNRTHWRQAKPALLRLKHLCTGPSGMLSLPEDTMYEILRPLGFGKSRTKILKAFCKNWRDWGSPFSYMDVYVYSGCGEYAAQSWAIFIDKMRPAGEVTDHKLQWYLEQHLEIV